MNKHLVLVILSILLAAIVGATPAIPNSSSPDGKYHAFMDIDRDASIQPEWKNGSYPMIEITEKATGQIITSIPYFGAYYDDQRPLREHIKFDWRNDSKAFGLNIHDRYYSFGYSYIQNKDGKFMQVMIPSYTEMTGYPEPDRNKLRPRGRSGAVGWTEDGHLIYGIWFSPEFSYNGKDPLAHQILLDVTTPKAKPVYKPEENTTVLLIHLPSQRNMATPIAKDDPDTIHQGYFIRIQKSGYLLSAYRGITPSYELRRTAMLNKETLSKTLQSANALPYSTVKLPADQTLVLTHFTANGKTTKTYDRTKLPAEMKELIDMLGGHEETLKRKLKYLPIKD